MCAGLSAGSLVVVVAAGKPFEAFAVAAAGPAPWIKRKLLLPAARMELVLVLAQLEDGRKIDWGIGPLAIVVVVVVIRLDCIQTRSRKLV